MYNPAKSKENWHTQPDRGGDLSSVFAPDVAIIDLFAPYRWLGIDEAKAWYATIMPARGQWASAHESVTLGNPFVSIVADKRPSRTGTGDHAYLVYPVVLRFTRKGTPSAIEGQWAFTLVKQAGHWLITAHSWATTKQTPPGALRYSIR